MEPEGSLPHSQQPATCPYPEPCYETDHKASDLAGIHTKHINTLCGQNVELLNVKPGGT
jgi:hypothetical protein